MRNSSEDLPEAALTYPGGVLSRHGRPHRVLAGSLHYFRVHPEQWRDRLERLAALGLNTVDTYVPWNFHERREGAARFDGPRDLERFVRLAATTGLDVIVRPGPYICAEWDNGGLPAWLTDRPGMRLRSSYQPYLEAVGRWFDELIPRVAALQAAHGGPVVAVQVENEYGSYGDDHTYVQWLHDALATRGITELRYTADGPTDWMVEGGTLPGVLATATLGTRAADAARLLRARSPQEPFLVAEFWNGWFDHWGEKHHTRAPASAVGGLAEILAADGSVSLYPAHGGTNFGLWSGANHAEGLLQPTVTSYDSDAPVAEDGTLTAKFHAVRELLSATSGTTPPPPPPAPAFIAARTLPLTPRAGLLAGLAAVATPVASPDPLSFGELGQSAGLVLYEAHPVLPHGDVELNVSGLHDRAQVFVDGAPVGILDRESGSLPLRGEGRAARLELLVENQGRVNYGPLLGQGKGILGSVRLGQRKVHRWTTRSLPLDEWTRQDLDRAAAPAAHGDSGLATARFTADAPADTFLALPGFGKGFVWLNGTLLGRYWEIGPQVTLYVPGPLVTAGENHLTLLELEHFGERVELRERPELGPSQEYIETFD